MDLFTALEDWKPIDGVIQTSDDFISLIYQPLRHALSGTVVGFDTETTNIEVPDRFHGIDLLGISLAWEEKSYYIPVGHITNGPQLLIEKIMPLLNQVLFERDSIIKVAHNLKFDMAMTQKYGAKFKHPFYCTQIMSWLLDEGSRHSLEFLTGENLGHATRKYTDINHGSLIDARMDEVGDYAREDSIGCLQLFELFRDKISDEELTRVLELEMGVLPVVVDMEVEGMTINYEELKVLRKKVMAEVMSLESRIFNVVGHPFNVDSSKQLRFVLYKELNLEPPLYTKGGEQSTDVNALKMLKGEHEIIDLLLNYRTMRKLQTTYTEGFNNIRVGDKIYGEFNQMGTETGRFSSSNPNLQNLPRDSKKIQFRRIFSAPPGYIIIDSDYGQLELRLLAHFTQDESLLQGFRDGIDGHTTTAATMFEVPYDKVTKEQRQIAKGINFGLLYGAGVMKLASILGKDLSFAKEMLNLYKSKYEGVFRWREQAIKSCKNKLYVRTLTGRKRRLWDVLSSDEGIRGHAEREAVNFIIQGTAADVAKEAMVSVLNEFGKHGLKIISQVHDEIIMLCPEDRAFDLLPDIRRVMESVFQNELTVPLVAEPGIGRSWTEAKL